MFQNLSKHKEVGDSFHFSALKPAGWDNFAETKDLAIFLSKIY